MSVTLEFIGERLEALTVEVREIRAEVAAIRLIIARRITALERQP